jgi:hypothetical protein
LCLTINTFVLRYLLSTHCESVSGLFTATVGLSVTLTFQQASWDR